MLRQSHSPHGGVRPFRQKSTSPRNYIWGYMQRIFGHVTPHISAPTKPSWPTVWIVGHFTRTAAEREGDNLKGCDYVCLKMAQVKAIIRLCLRCSRQIRWTANPLHPALSRPSNQPWSCQKGMGSTRILCHPKFVQEASFGKMKIRGRANLEQISQSRPCFSLDGCRFQGKSR